MSPEEKEIINIFFRDYQPQDSHKKGKKKEKLPPGWQKKVARGSAWG
jgi:hypothetical protein